MSHQPNFNDFCHLSVEPDNTLFSEGVRAKGAVTLRFLELELIFEANKVHSVAIKRFQALRSQLAVACCNSATDVMCEV